MGAPADGFNDFLQTVSPGAPAPDLNAQAAAADELDGDLGGDQPKETPGAEPAAPAAPAKPAAQPPAKETPKPPAEPAAETSAAETPEGEQPEEPGEQESVTLSMEDFYKYIGKLDDQQAAGQQPPAQTQQQPPAGQETPKPEQTPPPSQTPDGADFTVPTYKPLGIKPEFFKEFGEDAPRLAEHFETLLNWYGEYMTQQFADMMQQAVPHYVRRDTMGLLQAHDNITVLMGRNPAYAYAPKAVAAAIQTAAANAKKDGKTFESQAALVDAAELLLQDRMPILKAAQKAAAGKGKVLDIREPQRGQFATGAGKAKVRTGAQRTQASEGDVTFNALKKVAGLNAGQLPGDNPLADALGVRG